MADYNSLVNLYRTATQAEEEEEKRKSNQIYDNQAQVINDIYNSAIETSDADYRRLEREAEIQRLINKNEVAEDMANLGHKDSGLSRDQTAAVEIAASNQKANISLARQQAKEAKILEMKSKLAEIENNRISADNSISNAYTKLATDNAAAYIKNEQENAEKNKGIITTTNGMLSRDYYGNLAENGVTVEKNEDSGTVTYTDRNTGKKTSFPIGTNPYTNTVNKDIYKKDANGKEMVCSNGYQPSNIDGVKLTDSKQYYADVNGNKQKVWELKGDAYTPIRYVVWRGDLNAYVGYDPISDTYTGYVYD